MPELIDPRTGAAYDVPDDQLSHAQAQWGLVTPEQQALTEQYGSAGEQAKAAGKLAANVATFGLVGDKPEDRKAIGVFKDQSPTLAMLTEMAGAAAPGMAGGAVAGAALRGLGLGARAAELGAVVAEDVSASGAVEREGAALEGRDIDIANIVSGVPLAMGVSAAARIGRIGENFSAYSAGKRAGQAARGVLVPDVAAEANAISKGAAVGRARRSVGAAGALDEARVPLSEAEVRYRAENFDDQAVEMNKAAGDVFDELYGGDAPLFDEVHNVGHKYEDYKGRMGDADRVAVGEFSAEGVNTLKDAAEAMKAKGHASLARKIDEHAENIKGLYKTIADDPSAIANEWNEAKRTLDYAVADYGQMRDAHARGIADELNDVANHVRSGLEDAKTWGPTWAEAQKGENAIWSGEDGIIRNAAYVKHTMMDRAPGAAGKVRKGSREYAVYNAKGDFVERYLGMNDRDYAREIKATRKALERMQDMTLLKTEAGVPSMSNTPVMRLQSNIDKAKVVLDELDNLREAMNARGGKDIYAKSAAKRTARGPLEAAFDVGEKLPVVGSVMRAGREGVEAATGRPLFDVPVKPARPELTGEAAFEAVSGRASRGQKTPYNKPPPVPPSEGGAIPRPGPRSVDAPEPSAAYAPQAESRSRQAGSASVGAMAGAAGLGVAALAAHPVTELLKGMNDDQAAVRERAALGLVAPATRPPALPSSIERFREGARTLAESFALRKDDLIQALSNPEALIAGLDDAFGDLGDTHPEVYGALVARAHAAAQYVMTEAPPSVAIGITRPDGINPDPLALAKFADIWSGAFNPGDVIYDVGTGTATPTQIKALKNVHPDVYDALRLDILKAVGDSGARVPFETLRKLDVLFDVPGIAPPSFQPAMSQTMQQAWREPAGGNRAKAGEVTGPSSPTAKFSQGPSSPQ